MMADYMTAREVAAKWGCSTRQVRRLCERGRLSALQEPGFGKWRIAIAEVERYEAANTRSAETVQPASTPAPTQEVSAPVKLDGFTLPADYVPVFAHRWPGHVPAKKKASSVSR